MKEGDSEYLARYYTELPKQRAQQAILLEELRGLGIVGILEKQTKKKIVPIRPRHFKYFDIGQYIPVEWVTEDELRQADSHLGKWGIVFPNPKMRGSGRWSDDLRINMTSDIWQFPHRQIGEDLVQVAYTQDKKFIVKGEKVTFAGKLPQDEQVRDSLVIQVINEAFGHPKQTRYPSSCLPSNGRSFHVPIIVSA